MARKDQYMGFTEGTEASAAAEICSGVADSTSGA